MRGRLAVFLPLFLFVSLGTGSVRAERDVDGLEELLPHHETEAERLRWFGRGDLPGADLRADPPPTAPIRNCAEWEPASGVLIRYPLGLPYNLLRDFDDDVTLHVIVSSTYQSTAIANFVANGVDTSKVQWLVRTSDSIWTRDYGPWFVFDGNGDITIINHVYNRPYRPNDNLIPLYFGNQQGIPVVSHDMYHTGGNYMTDGAHFSMSTDLVYDEAWSANGMTPSEVDQLMEDYYGITTYHVVDDISSSGIHHIDTWGKFLDEETVLIKEVTSSHYTYANLEQRATLIASLPSSTGRNYTVHRVYCQNIGGGEPASYTNSLILNDHIYVPCFNNATYDTAAVETYRSCAPGYVVKGYYYSGFLTDDALHCRAKGVMDSGMLRVEHVPIREERMGAVTMQATVDDRSETGVSAVELHYRYAGGSWESVAMGPVGGDEYEGTIPNPPSDTTVDYYVHAADNSGREAGMPRTEPASWYTFSLLGDATGVAAVASPAPAAGAYPNPFREETRFQFELKYPERVDLTVYDVRGRVVRRLITGERGAGVHEIRWDGADEQGRPLPAGVYYFRLRAAGIVYSRPVVLVR
jgi:agmatine deiminase